MTVSAIACSAGSEMRERSNTTAAGTDLLLEALDDERDVVAAESGAVAERGAYFALPGLIGREIQIAAGGIRSAVVDGGRHDLVADRQQRRDQLHGTRGAEHVPRHGLRGGDAELPRRVAEHLG